MVRILRKIIRNARDYGWKKTLSKSAATALSIVYRRLVYRLYRLPIAPDAAPPDEDGSFVFRLLSPEDTDALAQVEAMAEWLEGRLAAKLAAGDVCLAAMDGDRVAAFNIIAFGRVEIPLIHTHHSFHAGQAWSEHIAVHKDYRRRHLASRLRGHVFAELARRGVRLLYGGTLIDNLPALNLARGLGFVEFADAQYTKCFWRHYTVYKRVRS